ncbi:T9SS type A sorting domain-containing protein [bacterium]|nr:T9SS type A sorting domain-containing protein [bacterium]
MKKLMTFLAIMVGFSSLGQNGYSEILTPPTNNSAYILVDTMFTLEESNVGYTEVYLHFANPTPDDVKALQFQFSYDDAAFSSAEVYWGPVAASVTDKYGSYYSDNGDVNVVLSYIGNSSSFGWSDGAIVKVKLNNSASYNSESDSIQFISSSYQNLYTTGNGVDNTLGRYNYGGNFQMPEMNFPIHVYNVDSSDAQGVWYSAYSRHKDSTAGQWSLIEIDSTNSDGLAIVTTQLDTTKYHLRLVGQTDTMTDGSALSITDAYKLANHSSQQDTLSGIEWLQGDINEDSNVSISDAFAMFNRLALQSSTWNTLFSGIYNVTLLTPTAYQAAVQSQSAPSWSVAPRQYNIDTIVNSNDSAIAFLYVVGDVTNTGYNNPAVLVAKMADPSSGTDYILDPAVYMSNIDDTVQFQIPKLVMTDEFTMEVPVTLYTFGNDLGAIQMGIEYDTSIFSFNSIQMGDATSKWTSLLSVEDGKVFWAGHEDKLNPSLVTNMTTQFTFVFDVDQPTGWQTSPLRIFNKAAGDEFANDVNIKPSPNDGSVVNRISIDPELLELMEGFRVYPNPTSDLYGNWIVFEHHTELENGEISATVYDVSGKPVMLWSDRIYNNGFQLHGFTLEGLPEGMYIVRLTTPDRDKSYRIIKK